MGIEKVARVAVFDLEPIYCLGLELAIRADKRLSVVSTSTTLEEALGAFAKHAPDIIVLGCSGKVSLTLLLADVKNAYLNAKVVVIHDDSHPDLVTAALSAGAFGFLLKSVSAADLCRALVDVYRGDQHVAPSLAGSIIRMRQTAGKATSPYAIAPQLKDREKEVLDCISAGMTNREIAQALNLSVKTVKFYMSVIMQKIGVRNRVEAAAFMDAVKSALPH